MYNIIEFHSLFSGQTSNTKEFYEVYKVFLIFWIMIGLGYLVMILGFISRAMRCQQMSKIEQKLSQNLKMTQSKVWNEFMKDITYVRRMLNEMYLIKFRVRKRLRFSCVTKDKQIKPQTTF
jgi:hypothetical protein